MRLLFVRHAAAEDKASFRGPDLDRCLTDDGRNDARKMFMALKKLYSRPDLILSSRALRASETAQIFSVCFEKVEIVESELLNPGCGFHNFRKLISGLSGRPELVVVVGHEPDFSHILAEIIADGNLRIDVKKTSCIEVEINSICKGELKLMLTPKTIAKLTE